MDLNKKITQEEFAKLVGISQPTVSFWVSEGILKVGDPACVWLLKYCDRLRKMAAGRYTGEKLDLSVERAHLARVQKEKIEMQNAVTRGELAPVTILEEVLSKAGARTVKILEALPSKLKRSVPGWTAKMSEVARDEVARACNEVANLSLTLISEEDESSDE